MTFGGQPFAIVYPLSAVVALAVALSFTPLVGQLAMRLGVVAYPQRDRWHRVATPLLGGIAIFLAIIPVFFLLPQPNQPDRFDRFGGLLIGATIMFGVGLYDDLRGLPPYGKLLAQVVAACVLIIGGLPLNQTPLPLLLVPLSIFWIVGVTNAFNLLDNMDGLSAGIAIVVALTLAGYNHIQGDRQMAMLCLIVAGSAAGFLVFNFNPARIFMGDSGSLLLGYMLSCIVVLGASKATSELMAALLIPVAVMALPILDTSLVTVMRALNRRPISRGGRDHLSHRLVAIGLSERSAVLVLYGVSATAGALVLASRFIGGWTALSIGVVLAVAILFFGIYLAQVRIYSEKDYGEMEGDSGLVGKLVLSGTLLYKRQLAEMLLDLTLICVALLGAYLIKFDFVLEKRFVEQFVGILPYVVAVKLSALFLLGNYRTVWRYLGRTDLFRMGGASALGSAISAAIIFVVFRAEGFPRGVLTSDLLIFTVLIVSARVLFVSLPDLLGRFHHHDIVRVVIVGAGDIGELVLRAIRRHPTKPYRVVGFLDGDESKMDRAIQGVRVLGSTEKLEDVVAREGVQEVVVAGPAREQEALADRCRRLGVSMWDAGSFIQNQLEAQPVEVGK
ncbi:MAG TPA: Gfo/Idh/MocA family oxidoreductase [Chloroflexota bacterium]|nr:Gfo/Idh/MocA family oxidoreductase [Chloroflexota bacterium]